MQRIKADDTPDDRYRKMIPVATRYSIIQFGLSAFKKDPVADEYVAQTFNFYLFPNGGADLVLSADSIAFLRGNNMDFGKWMSSGLSFVDSRGQEFKSKKLADSIAVKPLEDDGKGMVLTRESDIAFGKRNIDGLSEFLGNDALVEYQFEDTNSYLRRYLYDQGKTK